MYQRHQDQRGRDNLRLWRARREENVKLLFTNGEAMALLKEQEKSEGKSSSSDNSNSNNESPAEETNGKKTSGAFDPGSLSANDLATAVKFAAAMHGTQQASASTTTDQDHSQPERQQQGNVVKRIMTMFEQGAVNASHVQAATDDDSLDNVYIPK